MEQSVPDRMGDHRIFRGGHRGRRFFFRGASFCKYVCPIGQFHFVQSLVSPFEVKTRDLSVCRTCKTFDCIRGNEQQRGCELRLFQPKKESNLDCTFCLDCVQGLSA